MRPDIILIGHVSKDIMIDHLGNESRITGGAVVQSGISAHRSASAVKIVTRMRRSDRHLIEPMEKIGIDWRVRDSEQTTSIKNIYYTEDKERRDVFLQSRADPFDLQDIPEEIPRVYHLAGLFYSEIPDSMIVPLSEKAEVALDAQGVLRRVDENGDLLFEDWENKRSLLPYVAFFKVDTAEAEILTGLTDRYEAARQLCSWGAREVMLTHNTEVLVCSEGELYTAPYTNTSTLGRTGRGDTTFSAYLAWRREHGIGESTAFAAALCSIKMETPGPFDGTVADVLERMNRL